MAVVGARVKQYLAQRYGVRVSEGVIEALNAKVLAGLDAARERCEANGRKTLKVCDL